MSLYWQRQRDMESYGSQHGWISWAQTNVSLSAVKDSFGCCQRFVWVLPFLSCNSINLHCYVCPAMIVIRQWGLSTFPVWRAPKMNILSSNSVSIFNLRSIISIIFISHTEDFQWKCAAKIQGKLKKVDHMRNLNGDFPYKKRQLPCMKTVVIYRCAPDRTRTYTTEITRS